MPFTYLCYLGFAIYGIAHNSVIINDKQGIPLERAEPVKSDWTTPFIQDLKVIDKDETCGPAAFSGFQKTFPGFMGVWKKGKTPGIILQFEPIYTTVRKCKRCGKKKKKKKKCNGGCRTITTLNTPYAGGLPSLKQDVIAGKKICRVNSQVSFLNMK